MKFLDPIHKTIELPDYLLPVIESSQMQRLKRIQQTHFTDLVATDGFNRFNHSIAVTHLAINWLTKATSWQLSRSDKFHFIMSCLLHDVSHFPFGHVIEGLLNFRHGDFVQQVVSGHLKPAILASASLAKVNLVLPRITNIISGDVDNEIDEMFHQILSGATSLDGLDYVVRDSHINHDKEMLSDLSEHFSSIHSKFKEASWDPSFRFFHECISKANESSYHHWRTRLGHKSFIEALLVCILPATSGNELAKLDDLQFMNRLIEINQDQTVRGELLSEWLNMDGLANRFHLIAEYPLKWKNIESVYKKLPLSKNGKTLVASDAHMIESQIVEMAAKSQGAELSSPVDPRTTFMIDFPPYPRTDSFLYYREHQQGTSPVKIRAFHKTATKINKDVSNAWEEKLRSAFYRKLESLLGLSTLHT